MHQSDTPSSEKIRELTKKKRDLKIKLKQIPILSRLACDNKRNVLINEIFDIIRKSEFSNILPEYFKDHHVSTSWLRKKCRERLEIMDDDTLFEILIEAEHHFLKNYMSKTGSASNNIDDNSNDKNQKIKEKIEQMHESSIKRQHDYKYLVSHQFRESKEREHKRKRENLEHREHREHHEHREHGERRERSPPKEDRKHKSTHQPILPPKPENISLTEKEKTTFIKKEKRTPTKTEKTTPTQKEKTTPTQTEKTTSSQKEKTTPTQQERITPIQTEKATPTQKEKSTPTESIKSKNNNSIINPETEENILREKALRSLLLKRLNIQ